jgi:nitrilase
MGMLRGVVRVAAVQAEPVTLDCEATVDKACRLIADAARQGAKLIVFPETFIPVYPNSGVWGKGLADFNAPRAKQAYARLWHNSVDVPGPVTTRLGEAAQQAGATVVMGVNERVAGSSTLYNTLVFIGPDGKLIGKHRKLMPTNHERLVHGLGDGSTLRVFDTPAGKIGGLICWENWMPLARYALYAQGEQIHVAPTADDGEMFVVNARNTAFEGRVYVISVCSIQRNASYPDDFALADQVAAEPDYLLSGGSVIVGPDGDLLAGPLWKEEVILCADLDLDRLVEERQLLDVVGHYARPEVLSLRVNRQAATVVTDASDGRGG